MKEEGGYAVFGSTRIVVNMSRNLSPHSSIMGEEQTLSRKKRGHVNTLLTYMAILSSVILNFHVYIMLTWLIKDSSRKFYLNKNFRRTEK